MEEQRNLQVAWMQIRHEIRIDKAHTAHLMYLQINGFLNNCVKYKYIILYIIALQ